MVGLAVGFVAGSAWAQGGRTWPDKPVHIVVPLIAGSATDVMARMVAKQLGQQLDQPFIVDNKPGAGGTIGMGTVARAKPDGYTLLVQSASYTVCVPMIRQNRLLALGMGRSKRSAALPGLPTTLELGVPNSDYDLWVGLFVPAGTPREIVQKLYAETARPIDSADLRAGMSQLGAEPSLVEPDAYNLQLKQDIADNAALVKAADIPINGGQ